MSFPKNFKRAFIAFVAMLALVASGVGFGFTSASASTVNNAIEATSFAVTQTSCETVTASFAFTNGPGDYTIVRKVDGAAVATGTVSSATGTVSGIVMPSQPAGLQVYGLYNKTGGTPITTRVEVMVDACVTPPDSQLEASNLVITVGDCFDGLRTLQFSFDFTGGPDTWSIDRDPVDNGPNVANGSVTTVTGSASGTIVGQPAGEFLYAIYGGRGGIPTDRVTVVVADCTIVVPPTDTKVTPTAPTSVDKAGTKDDTYTVPNMDGVDYLVDNEIVAAGPYPGTDTVTVVAKAKSGYVLDGTATWTFEFTNVVSQPDPVIAPRASLSSECEILDGEKSGLTVVNAALGSDSSDGDSFEVAETIDGVTLFYYIPVASGEEITPQVFYSTEDGKKVTLVINARDVTRATLSFDTATCAATTVAPPIETPTKVCPVGTKWVDLNSNGKVDKGECKTPVAHKPPVVNPPVVTLPVKQVTSPNNSVPSADTGWETRQNQGGATLPWLIGLGLLVGVALVTTTIVSRRRGAYRD